MGAKTGGKMLMKFFGFKIGENPSNEITF